MASINILDSEIISSCGNLKETVEIIKNGMILKSSKSIKVENEDIEIPFYSLKKEVQQNQKDIYKVLKNLLSKLLLKIEKNKRKSTALIIGTSLIDWHLVDAVNNCAYEYKKTPYTSKKYSIDSYSKELSLEFGLSEFTMTINTACTSSANALLEAKNLINAGVIDYAIVLGLEIFSPIMSSGFYNMDLLSKDMAKPFDKNRDGLVLGEALAGIVLGKDDSKWSLEGGFSNCNSDTITSVSKEGDECVEVMQKALENCNLKAEDITALKAHATGSYSNDLAEINAISRVFDSTLPFTALKPYIGHTIGASGVLEIAIFIAAIEKGFIPKTFHLEESIIDKYSPITENIKCDSGIFMCNYFGFGGNNISLIIRKEPK